MLRVLCLGYSVTERPGYVERANAMAEADGGRVAFLRSGWGGHSLPTIAYMIDEILDAIACDVVLLELFTGAVRYFDGAAMRLYIDEILAATARRGLAVAFLNLFQGGVDYEAEACADLIEEYRALYAIPGLDLAAAVWAAGGQDNAHLLKDGTHVTAAGGDLYGTLVHGFVHGLLRAPERAARGYAARFAALPRRFESLPLHALPGLACPFEMRRNGIPLRFLEVSGGQEVEIDLGRRRCVLGVMVAYGPTSGRLRFYDGGIGCTVLAHDAFSYYVRSFMLPIYFRSARRFRVAQHADLPDVALNKGAPDVGARVGRASHVFCARDIGRRERAALLRHGAVRGLRAWRARACRLLRRHAGAHAARIMTR